MDIDYTVAALMFQAIPLMMTMYSNRFHTLSALIRKIHDQYTFEKKVPPEWENQLHVLNKRTNYLKYVMGFASFGFLFNMLTVLLLYLERAKRKWHIRRMEMYFIGEKIYQKLETCESYEEALEIIEEAAETVSKRRRSRTVKIPVFKHQEVENIKAKEFLEI